MATALTGSIDGGYTAPLTINVHFLDDGSGTGWENQGTITDAAGHTFGYDGWTAFEQQQARLAFSQFSAVANVAFNFVADIAVADFVLATGNNAEVGSPGYWNVGGGAITVNGVDYGVDGVGVFNWEAQGWDFLGPGGGLEAGGLGFVTLLDNIARGLGLAFPHNTDGGSTVMNGVSAPTGDFGDFDLNQGIYTTMSFNDGWHTAPHGSSSSDTYGWQGTPMALDIAVLQEAYGANMATNLTDTTYVLGDTNVTGTFYQAIWDTGGTDTIAYDGNGHATIDLRSATLEYEHGGGGFVSYVSGIHGGFTIAHGVFIENAIGGAGNDTLIGNDADNVLAGGPGADHLDGGAGSDTASYLGAVTGVVANLNNPSKNDSEALGDSYISIENLEGSSFDDKLVGDAAANDIFAGAGIDLIAAGRGNDRIFGGADNDRVYGGAGDDRLVGEAGADLLHGGPDSDFLAGSESPDRLHGGSGQDRLAGGDGDDILVGGADGDKMYGGSGHDRLSGQDGADMQRGGPGSDTVGGGHGNDRLFGGATGDRLFGGVGNDRLAGEAGDDYLAGGAGMDAFVFQPNGSHDRVADFEDGFDVLVFRAFGFASKTDVLGLAAQVGASVEFTLPDGGSVKLLSFDIALLGAEDVVI